MSSISKKLIPVLLMITSLACSLATMNGNQADLQAEILVTEAPVGKPTITEPFLPPTDTPAAGFVAGTPLDPATLPALTSVGAGGEPTSCTSEDSEPSISLGYGMFPYQSMCLNNFPNAPDSSAVTAILVDPTGQSYTETFTYTPDGMLNRKKIKSGYIESGEGIDGNPGTPGVNLELYLPASLPCGDWTAFAKTQDGSLNVGPSALSVDCASPRLSVLADVSSNPFISPDYSWDGPSFTNGETLTVFGSAYRANTTITVALYHQDSSNADQNVALYAVSILSDASGNFQVPFVVGAETPKGPYTVVAAPEIDPALRLHPFGARFLIE